MIEGVLFEQKVLKEINRCTRQFDPLEAGGLMLGFRKGAFLHVTHITTPSAWDRQSRTSFFRSKKAHRLRAMRLWRTSGGLIDWIGEWHSHPRFKTDPSGIDRRNWKKLVKHRGAPMVFPISNGHQTDVFVLDSFEASFRKLQAIGKGEDGTLFSEC